MNAETPIRTLLVEDSPTDQVLIQEELASSVTTRFAVHHAARLEEALDYLKHEVVQIILLDLSLPDSSGLETFYQIQSHVPNIPILILSGLQDETKALEAVRGGAQEYLVKGEFSGELLARIIRHAIERHHLTEELQKSNERYELAAMGSNDGLWDWDLNTNKLYFSPRWKAILGYKPEDLSNDPDEWFKRVYSVDEDHFQATLKAHLSGSTDHFECEYRLLHRDGMYRWMLCRGLAVRTETGDPYRMVGSHTDVTRLKIAEANITHDAHHDSLTRLPNRRFFNNRLARMIDRAKGQKDYQFAVLFLDLDGFKVINDSLGHGAGDQVLVTTARRLEECIRTGDLVARMGGDEFTILLDDLIDISDAIRVAKRVLFRLSNMLLINGHELEIQCSIGIASSTLGHQSTEDMLRDADTAMYQAKAAGKSGYQIFDQTMHRAAMDRLQTEAELRKSLSMDESFLLHYQPIVSCKTGHIVGAEALVRWNHPVRGMVSPVGFVPLAEETGLISELGLLVLRQACTDIKRMWTTLDSRDPFWLNINVSCKQLSKHFPQIVREFSEDLCADAPEINLNLELTETVFLGNDQERRDILDDLCDAGVHLCIDDFGTGYSSLQYLNESPFDILKIDRSFLGDLNPEDGNTALVKSMLLLGENLGMSVIAEGVETTEQYEKLKAFDCEYVQGYLFSKPVHLDAFQELLVNQPFVEV